MNLREKLLDRMSERKRRVEDWVVESGRPSGYKRALIARQIANSVMPRRIFVQYGNRTLAMDVGHRRICAAIFRDGDQVSGSFDFTTAMPPAARDAFDDALRKMIESGIDLTFHFLPSEKSYPEAVGAEAETVLGNDAFITDGKNHEPEPVTAPTPIRPVEMRRADPVTSKPAADAGAAGSPAARFRTLARDHAERIAGFGGSAPSADPELPPECSDAFRAFLDNVGEALGDDLLCIVVPSDGSTQYAVALSDDQGTAAEFRPNRLARILKAWEASKPGG